jgi:hypothetical protein
MENIYAYDARIPTPKSSGYTEDHITRFLGTVTKLTRLDSSIEVRSFVPREGHVESDHSFQTVASGNSSITFNPVEFYQEHMWVRVSYINKTTLAKEFAGQMVRFDSIPDDFAGKGDDWVVTNTINLSQDNESVFEWAQILLEEAASFPETKAMYVLTPQMEKPKREAEDIPPMPGEKPRPKPAPEGDPDGQGQGGQKDDAIPPMPGSAESVTDKNRRTDNTGALGKGWWGTSQGEGK